MILFVSMNANRSMEVFGTKQPVTARGAFLHRYPSHDSHYSHPFSGYNCGRLSQTNHRRTEITHFMDFTHFTPIIFSTARKPPSRLGVTETMTFHLHSTGNREEPAKQWKSAKSPLNSQK